MAHLTERSKGNVLCHTKELWVSLSTCFKELTGTKKFSEIKQFGQLFQESGSDKL